VVLFFAGIFLSPANIYAADAFFYLGLLLIVIGGIILWQLNKTSQAIAAQEAQRNYFRRQQVMAAQAQQVQNPPQPSPSAPGPPSTASAGGVVSQPATPPVPRPRVPQFARLSIFLERYRPSDRFGREREYEIELAQALRNEFGRLNVQRQVPIPQGTVDIQVCGIGIELKIAGSAGSVQRLPDQVAGYQQHYGPNLMVVVFDDTGDADGMASLKRRLSTQGIQVFVK